MKNVFEHCMKNVFEHYMKNVYTHNKGHPRLSNTVHHVSCSRLGINRII